jgi:type 1 glutamine amidotransferase
MLGLASLVAPASVVGAATPITAGHPYLPREYELAAYVNCGSDAEVVGTRGLAVRQRAGDAHTFPNAEGPLRTVACHQAQVEYEVTGLKQDADYVLGFTWFDVDGGDRRQSVRFGTGQPSEWSTVLPPTPAAAFSGGEPTWARVQLPLTTQFIKNGRLVVAFANEQGPNAVVNELWLLERPQDVTRGNGRKRVLLVTGDDYPGHRWRETAPELAAVLREDTRLEVSVIEAPAVLASPLLAHYDAVVVHFKNYAERLPLGEAEGKGLERFARSGKGVIFSHFACGAFQEWPGFVNVAGRVWNPELRGHDPHGEFLVEVADDGHAVTENMENFRTTDELYTCLDGDAPIRVLCAATSKVDQKVYPIAFVVEVGKGRVFQCTLGHDVEAFHSKGARMLFRRATVWAAGMNPTHNAE